MAIDLQSACDLFFGSRGSVDNWIEVIRQHLGRWHASVTEPNGGQIIPHHILHVTGEKQGKKS